MGTKFQLRMVVFWRWVVVVVAPQCECTWCYWTVHLKWLKMVNLCYAFFYHNKKEKISNNLNDLYSESSDCCSSPSDPWCFHTLQGWLCPTVSFASIYLETIYSYFLAYQVVFPLVNNCLILKFCFNTHSFFFLLVCLYWYRKPNSKLYLVLCAL